MHRFFGFVLCAVFSGAVCSCGSSYDYVTNLDAPGTEIVCFGDSITYGYGATPGNDYPSVLERLLGVPVVNAGVNGDTTASARARLQEDVLARSPRLVVVELGGNDLLQQRPKEATIRDLDAITAQIVASGAMAVLVHAKLGILNDPYWEGIEGIADAHGAVIVKNALDDILGRPSRMYDQIHPNDAGYALLAERVAAVVGPVLDAADAAR